MDSSALQVPTARSKSKPSDFPDTRWSLVARLSSSPAQIGVVVELYANAISRFLSTRFPKEWIAGRVDDVFQEVALDLLKKPEVLARAKPGNGSKFRYLIMTMALNAARNFLRKEDRHGHREQSIDPTDQTSMLFRLVTSDEPIEPPMKSAMDQAWAESVLAQALDDLDGWVADGTLEAEAVRILHEHLIHGQPLREVAKSLGLTLTSCHRRLAKARTYLQSTIMDRLKESGEAANGLDAAAACDLLLTALQRS